MGLTLNGKGEANIEPSVPKMSTQFGPKTQMESSAWSKEKGINYFEKWHKICQLLIKRVQKVDTFMLITDVA